MWTYRRVLACTVRSLCHFISMDNACLCLSKIISLNFRVFSPWLQQNYEKETSEKSVLQRVSDWLCHLSKCWSEEVFMQSLAWMSVTSEILGWLLGSHDAHTNHFRMLWLQTGGHVKGPENSFRRGVKILIARIISQASNAKDADIILKIWRI